MIQTILVLAVIFVGVAFAVYQVYDIYYAQNVGDDEALAMREGASRVSAAESAFAALRGVFPERLVSAAQRDETLSRNPEPLLRRRKNIVLEQGVKIRYLSLWTGRPVAHDWRKALLIVVLVDCLIAMFLGGLSLYTVAYEVPGATFAWMNDPVVILVLLVLVILLTHAVAKLDLYLHDLYRIGRLNRYLA